MYMKEGYVFPTFVKLGLIPKIETNFIAWIRISYADRLSQTGKTLTIQMVFLALQGNQ